MGCSGSKGKVYLAQNEEHVTAHAATLQELQLSMAEGAVLLCLFAKIETATSKESKYSGGVGISFLAFSSSLGIKTSKFALNMFARGCGLSPDTFPEQKMARRMDSHQFLKTITDLCLRTDVGLKGYAFDLYKDQSNGISTKAMITLVHETYDFCAVPGAALAFNFVVRNDTIGFGGPGVHSPTTQMHAEPTTASHLTSIFLLISIFPAKILPQCHGAAALLVP